MIRAIGLFSLPMLPIGLISSMLSLMRSVVCRRRRPRRPAYDLAVTHKKELMAIFKRLWKFKDDQPQRDQHLDLLTAELKELRDTLQMIK